MENRYLPDSVMLETLAKVQPLQAEILNSGRSCHVDGSVCKQFFWNKGTHINFDLTVFEELELVRQFEFTADMTERELLAEVESLAAYVDRIKKEA